jgi:hypothetical protein
VIDAATSAVTDTIPVGYIPDAVAVDPTAHTVYVTNSGAGTVSVINPPAPSAAPSGLAAAVAGPVSGVPSGVALTWTDNATAPAATLVRVERASDPGFTVGVTHFPLGAAATSYATTAVVEGATYYYRVRAENSGITSGWSDPVSIMFTTVPSPAPAWRSRSTPGIRLARRVAELDGYPRRGAGHAHGGAVGRRSRVHHRIGRLPARGGSHLLRRLQRGAGHDLLPPGAGRERGQQL